MINPVLKGLSDAYCFVGTALVHKKKIKVKNPKRILVIKHCCMGDIVMSTPFLRNLRLNFKDAEIDYMVGDWSRSIIEGHKDIDHLYRHLSDAGFSEKMRLIKTLKKKKYDIIFVCDVGVNDVFYAASLKPNVLVGFDAYNRGFALNYKLKRRWDDGMHEVDAYLSLLKIIGGKIYTKSSSVFVSQKDIKKAHSLLGKKTKKLVGMFPGGGLNPGTKMDLKHWRYNNYADVANYLIEKHNCKIIIIGSDSDKKNCSNLIRVIKKKTNVLNLCGKTSIKQACAVISLLDLFISNDSGLMHVSGAVKTNTIGIFGPTDHLRVGPYEKNFIPVFTRLNCKPYINKSSKKYPKRNCRPCYKQILGTFVEDCETRACMEKVTPKMVIAAIEKNKML